VAKPPLKPYFADMLPVAQCYVAHRDICNEFSTFVANQLRWSAAIVLKISYFVLYFVFNYTLSVTFYR